MSTLEDNRRKMADVVKELWKDKTGNEMSSLKRNPKEYLKSKGIVIEGDKDVQVIFEEPSKLKLYIPSIPDGVSISADDLGTQAAKTLSSSKEMF